MTPLNWPKQCSSFPQAPRSCRGGRAPGEAGRALCVCVGGGEAGLGAVVA